MQAAAVDAVGVVRLFLADYEDAPCGHIALVSKYDPRKGGMQATVVTANGNEVHWLEQEGKGEQWEWLQGMPIDVAYLEDEASGAVSNHRARIINWDLDKFLLCVEWAEQSGDSQTPLDADWISLVDDDWSWLDGARPPKQVVKAAFRSMRQQKKAARQQQGRPSTEGAPSENGAAVGADAMWEEIQQ